MHWIDYIIVLLSLANRGILMVDEHKCRITSI